MMSMRAVFAAVAMIITFGMRPPAPGADAGVRIAVLVSYQDAPFGEALKGFQGYLHTQGVQADYEVHALQGDASHASEAVQKIKKSGARLVFTLGSLATDAAIREIPDIPVIACLILRADTLKKAPNATGVALEFPLETQFSWLQRFLPDAGTIGVIYNPEENGKKIETASRIAKSLSLKLEAREVRVLQDVPAALEVLSRKADVLWGVPDQLALSPQIAKYILLFSFRNGIPFIGPSSTWVKAGALYALDWDYADLGAQSGAMAQKVLGGTSPSAIPPASPRRVLYSVNLNTARQMKITIPDELIRGAQSRF
jgi:putative tryptophan/tyrosine transport system substrate-binding protein